MPTAFGDVYANLCERYPDPRERGRQFEPLVAQVLRTDSQYRNRFRTVWRWNEWPGHDGGDYGIDIVAEGSDGELTAIQCKCYDPHSTLYASDPRHLPRQHPAALQCEDGRQHGLRLEQKLAPTDQPPSTAGAAS